MLWKDFSNVYKTLHNKMYKYLSCPSPVVEIHCLCIQKLPFWYTECVAATSSFCFVFSKIKNMSLLPCMTMTFLKQMDPLMCCLPTELCVILWSTVMHYIVVWFIVRQMIYYPGHCIELYAFAKKAPRENLKMG